MTESTGRIVKRYANRKLYDTKESRYVTLDQIAEMIRQGEDVKVVDNNSKEDLTSVTLAQIIFEEEKKQPSFLPLSALRNIIQSGGQSLHDLVSQLSESAERVGRVFRHDVPEGTEDAAVTDQGQKDKVAAGVADRIDPTKLVRDFMEGVQTAIDEWQKRLDANIHHAIESVSPLAPLQKEIQVLGERIADLERKLGQIESSEP
jgi:polyhydroxyalkanoate synthesis repressor PhaR